MVAIIKCEQLYQINFYISNTQQSTNDKEDIQKCFLIPCICGMQNWKQHVNEQEKQAKTHRCRLHYGGYQGYQREGGQRASKG